MVDSAEEVRRCFVGLICIFFVYVFGNESEKGNNKRPWISYVLYKVEIKLMLLFHCLVRKYD